MSKTIVIVDAEPVVRAALKTILESDGFSVLPASDPKAALELIQAANPDLIITNVSLPGMTGHDAMRLFREVCPDIPVLMVSGLPDSEVIRHWVQEEGFDAFPKPFTAQELKAKVREVLAKPFAGAGHD